MEKNYDQPIKMADLSKISNMSSRNFIRRFKKATGDTPIEYLQKIRIEAAKNQFEKGNTSISDVMYNTGYQDIKETLIPRLHECGERVTTHVVSADLAPRVTGAASYLAVNAWALARMVNDADKRDGSDRVGRTTLCWRLGGQSNL